MQVAELEDLLIEQGWCHYIEPLAQAKLDPPALQRSSEAQLRRAVIPSGRTSFGEVRTLHLTLDSIDRGDGLLPEADAPQPDGPAVTWSVDAVRAWLEGRGMGAAAAACDAARVNGLVLLSMHGDDIFERLELAMDESRRLEDAVSTLRREQQDLPASIDRAAAMRSPRLLGHVDNVAVTSPPRLLGHVPTSPAAVGSPARGIDKAKAIAELERQLEQLKQEQLHEG